MKTKEAEPTAAEVRAGLLAAREAINALIEALDAVEAGIHMGGAFQAALDRAKAAIGGG